MPASPRQIGVTAIVEDIRSGITDSQIMTKYHLSSRGLRSLFRKLLDSGAITPFEYTEWACFFGKSVELNEVRVFNRDILDFHLPVHEAAQPSVKGQVLNLSETGIGTWGIPAKVGQTKTLLIPVKTNFVVVEAKCQWTKVGKAGRDTIAGFEIAGVVQGDWDRLVKRVQELIRKRRKRAGKDGPADVVNQFARGLEQEPMEQLLPAEHAVGPESAVMAASEGVQAGRTGRHEPSTMPDETMESPNRAEEPSLAFLENRIEGDNYLSLFTTSRRHLAFLINPMSFVELTPETRQELLLRVKRKNTDMVSDLGKKARAVEQAILNSSLLQEN